MEIVLKNYTWCIQSNNNQKGRIHKNNIVVIMYPKKRKKTFVFCFLFLVVIMYQKKEKVF